MSQVLRALFQVPCRRNGRRGTVLVVVLALALLLAAQIYIIAMMNTSSFRQVDRVNANIRAIYTGEAAFSRIVARLKGASWTDRWFAVNPSVEEDVPLGNGSYTSYVAEVPHPDQKLVDVWIRAWYEVAVVSMYWRIRYLDGTLDFYAQVQPQFFTFVGEDVPPPTGPGGAGPLSATVATMINEQKANRDPARVSLTGIQDTTDLPTILASLGVDEPGSVLDATQPLDGSAPSSQARYLDRVRQDRDPPFPMPDPGSPVSTSSLALQFPTPQDLTGLLEAAFQDQGLPPASTPTATHFQDPVQAQQEWDKTAQLQSVGAAFNAYANNAIDYLNQMAQRFDQNGCMECAATMNVILGYFEDVTRAQAIAEGELPPDPSRVDPRPYDAARYTAVLQEYKRWWTQEGGL